MENFPEVKVNLIPPDNFSMSTESEHYIYESLPADETLRLNSLREATFLPVSLILEPNYLETS